LEYGAYEHLTFAYRDGRWIRAAREPEQVPGQVFAESECGDGTAIYIGPRPNGKGAVPLWWYDSGAEGWRQVPGVDIGSASQIDAATLGNGTQLLALSDDPQRPLRVLSRSDASPNWSERDVPPFGSEVNDPDGRFSHRARIDAGENSFLLVPHDPLKDGLYIGGVG
jgi:hypothetical protein